MPYHSIDNILIASPCIAQWGDMEGNRHARFCNECQKNVYDISSLSRTEAIDLIREKEGKLCVRFYRRTDGTILTADCPRGLRVIRRQYLIARAKVIAVVVGILGVLGLSSQSCRFPGQTMIGVPALPDSLWHSDTTSHLDTTQHH